MSQKPARQPRNPRHPTTPPFQPMRALPLFASLAAESIEGAALALERVHDIKRRDRLALCVFRVRDGVANHAFQECLEHAARLFVNHYIVALALESPLHTNVTYWPRYA